jgi:hypothetical protein
LFIAPIVDASRLQASMQFLEDVVFPEYPDVIAARLKPTAEIANEAGIEAYTFGAATISAVLPVEWGRTTCATKVVSNTDR